MSTPAIIGYFLGSLLPVIALFTIFSFIIGYRLPYKLLSWVIMIVSMIVIIGVSQFANIITTPYLFWCILVAIINHIRLLKKFKNKSEQ